MTLFSTDSTPRFSVETAFIDTQRERGCTPYLSQCREERAARLGEERIPGCDKDSKQGS